MIRLFHCSGKSQPWIIGPWHPSPKRQLEKAELKPTHRCLDFPDPPTQGQQTLAFLPDWAHWPFTQRVMDESHQCKRSQTQNQADYMIHFT